LSGRLAAIPLAVGFLQQLVSTGEAASQCSERGAKRVGSAASTAPRPTLLRLRRGPSRPPLPSARLRCSANPSAAACTPGSAAISFPAIPGWKGNGRHQRLAGNGDYDRYSPFADLPRPVRLPRLRDGQSGGKWRICGALGSLQEA
jgi:hypothetical protein